MTKLTLFSLRGFLKDLESLIRVCCAACEVDHNTQAFEPIVQGSMKDATSGAAILIVGYFVDQLNAALKYRCLFDIIEIHSDSRAISLNANQ
ncbi:hypothetical protein ILUMI_19544, partial [Ignelater luminosus]